MSDTMTKAEVLAYLRRTAVSYRHDALGLDQSGDPELRALAPSYRETGKAFDTAAWQFDTHGPLPPLPPAWRKRPLSHAAKCPNWPEGCGERARFEGKAGKSPASIRHRDGCKTGALLRGESVSDD